MEEQLAFPFPPPPNPLAARFGKDFFKSVPKQPGVYIMCNEQGRVLYVGQSGNIRVRLGYYRNARTGREPRRILRLVQQTRTLTWEVCDSMVDARIRENELLRLHWPRFNVANTLSSLYPYVIWRFENGELAWRIAETAAVAENERVYGAFKSRGMVRAGLAALSRLLWCAARKVESVFDLPRGLVGVKGPNGFAMPGHGWEELLHQFHSGESFELLERIQRALPPSKESFLRKLQDEDIAAAGRFYGSGPERHRKLRSDLGLGERLIAREELDDLLVLWRERLRTQRPNAARMNAVECERSL